MRLLTHLAERRPTLVFDFTSQPHDGTQAASHSELELLKFVCSFRNLGAKRGSKNVTSLSKLLREYCEPISENPKSK